MNLALKKALDHRENSHVLGRHGRNRDLFVTSANILEAELNLLSVV